MWAQLESLRTLAASRDLRPAETEAKPDRQFQQKRRTHQRGAGLRLTQDEASLIHRRRAQQSDNPRAAAPRGRGGTRGRAQQRLPGRNNAQNNSGKSAGRAQQNRPQDPSTPDGADFVDDSDLTDAVQPAAEDK